MSLLQLLAIGKVEEELLDGLEAAIPQFFGARCEILRRVLDPAPAFHGERRQYHSSELLQLMQGLVGLRCSRLLGVTEVDLYIPILTFVFGEAQIGGPCAVISSYRLRQEFYGLPADQVLLRQRLLKEATHELGHSFGLAHCDDYRCAMASSHSVEWIDLKESMLCVNCRQRAAGSTQPSASQPSHSQF
jgi:archaemetzincin